MTGIPTMMRAIGIPTPGGPAALVIEERPVPTPGAGEVLIQIAHAGVNRPDVLQRQGGYPPPPGAPDIPGLEISGVVVALGEDARRFRVGDKVCALLSGGGYAEYAAVHASNVLPVPAGLTLAEAAGVPETFFTVWHNVFERGALKAGETFLVHGGTSGIGTTAIQLAKVFGAKVIATAGGAEKCAACRELGADLAIDYRSQDFVTAARGFTAKRGVDVILDMVGGDYIQKNYEVAADSGRIVQIAFLRGPKVEVDFRRLMLKRLTHTGSTLRIRTVAEKAEITRAVEDQLWPLLSDGRVKPVMFANFPLAQASKAHELMETNTHIGKIILDID